MKAQTKDSNQRNSGQEGLDLIMEHYIPKILNDGNLIIASENNSPIKRSIDGIHQLKTFSQRYLNTENHHFNENKIKRVILNIF